MEARVSCSRAKQTHTHTHTQTQTDRQTHTHTHTHTDKEQPEGIVEEKQEEHTGCLVLRKRATCYTARGIATNARQNVPPSGGNKRTHLPLAANEPPYLYLFQQNFRTPRVRQQPLVLQAVSLQIDKQTDSLKAFKSNGVKLGERILASKTS